jgi:hypothetical protein
MYVDGWMDGCLLACLLAWFTHAVGSVGMDGMVRWYGIDEGMKEGIHVLVTEYMYVIV